MATQTTALQEERTDNDGASLNGGNGRVTQTPMEPPIPERLLPKVPTFPLEDGWRTVYDEDTQTWYDIPLTLRDILYPTEDDVGAVYMSQGQTHNLLISFLSELLRLFLSKHGWYFPNDVLIHWNIPGVPPKSPDIAAIPDVKLEPEGKKSFHVGRDGPMPRAIIEMTSESTRSHDFNRKPTTYASVGIQEYLIIDIWNGLSNPWKLYGYRLGKSPYYEEVEPDAEGGIILETLGLRFVPIGRERVDVFDITTGERLRSAQEYEEMAEAAAARAEAEAARANVADRTIAQLQARIQELETNAKSGE